MTARPLCLHCHYRTGCKRIRGLCWRCYKTPSIRCEYVSEAEANDPVEQNMANMTVEEVEAMVAEQSQQLPPWWHDEPRRKGEAPLPRAVRQGRGVRLAQTRRGTG